MRIRSCRPIGAGGCVVRAVSLGVALLALMGVVAPASAAHPKVEFDELVHESDVVFAGRVESMASRRVDGTSGIATDVSIRVTDMIHRKPRALPTGPVIVLTYAGGEVDGVGMAVSGSPHFEIGVEYVLFAMHDGVVRLHPLVGGAQGMFTIVRDVGSGRAYPLAPGSLGIRGVEQGVLSLTKPVARVENGRAVLAHVNGEQAAPTPQRPGDAAAGIATGSLDIVPIERFRELILAEAAKPLARPSVLRSARSSVDRPQAELEGKWPSNGFDEIQARLAESPTPVKEPRPDLAEVKEMSRGDGEATDENEKPMGELFESGDRATLCGCGFHDLFLVMEQVPTTWASYQPNNDCMYYYNQFMDIYRVSADDGTFGNNSQNEFCGFISNATLNSVYGFNWGGSLALTVTFFPSGCPCCEISQSDVMFNPAYSWVYSFASALGNSSVIGYLPTVIHELGHTWGLQRGSCVEDYSYSRPTVMHAYYWNVVEDGMWLHSWDSFAIRDIYDNQTGVLPRTDVGIESYVASGSLVNATTNTGTYRSGDAITVSNVTAENMSNVALADVRVRMWLSTNNIISTSDYQMGSFWSFASFSANGFSEFNMSTTVPNVPPGTYYVGLMITRSGASYLYDDISTNNTTYLYDRITIIPPLPSNDESENAFLVGLGSHGIDTTGATTDGFQHAACNLGSQNAWNDVWYRYTPLCDGTLTASTCNQATFDTVLVIYRDVGNHPPFNANQIGCNDDFTGCSGFSSRLSVTVSAGLPYLIRVGGYATTSRGTGTLTLSLVPTLANNACSGSILIGDGYHNINTNCATTDGIAHAGCQFDGQTYNDVWYRYVAGCDGDLTLSTCNIADYDTDLAVYRYTGACPPGNALLVGCNDDGLGCSGYSSHLTIAATNGQTYLIRVGGYQAGDVGTGTLLVSLACTPPPDCAGDANMDGMVTFADVTSVLEHWGFSYPGGTGPGDANHNGLVNFADVTSVLENWAIGCL